MAAVGYSLITGRVITQQAVRHQILSGARKCQILGGARKSGSD